MDITIIGMGYVGLVSGAILADFGHRVYCLDTDSQKIAGLRRMRIPIFEPGLEEIMQRNVREDRLFFTDDYDEAVEKSDALFLAVGTPPLPDGNVDMSYVLSAVRSIASHMNSYKMIVNKSTVPVGTAALVRQIIENVLRGRGLDVPFDVVSNPEFLREGTAVRDFSHPDRIVVGAQSERAREAMRTIYTGFTSRGVPLVETGIETAEMAKYASNAFLAVKISFINEIANLCDKIGADIVQVAEAMGYDQRIAPHFLRAGPGFGGSCFPKDTMALAHIARGMGERVGVVEAAIQANRAQKLRMVDKILAAMGTAEAKTIAVLGLAFKPNTDDMRDAPSLTILPELIKNGARIRACDPKVDKNNEYVADFGDSMTFHADAYEAARDADAVVLLTEWRHFRDLDWDRMRDVMRGRHFFDLRNVYDREAMRKRGFIYEGVGH
jgi:UDPglucose 6-dehydrogenase